jgi:hypothetical protein
VQIQLPLPPPPAATLHVPTGNNYGAALDAHSPVGRESGIPLAGRRRQFCAVEVNGRALAFVGHSTLERIPLKSFATAWKAGGWVEPEALWLDLAFVHDAPFEVSLHPTLDESIGHYHAHLEADYGAIPWVRDSSLPAWFHNLKLIVTLDMQRSHGEVMHSFAHLRDLCRELKAAGMGGGILFYLPGHNNRYDAGYPLFEPSSALGGAEGFREMVAAVHEAGHFVMPHACIWGADPYQSFFEEVEALAVPWTEREEIPDGRLGPYAAWPGPMPVVALPFDTGWQPLRAEAAGATVVFETPALPQALEAFLELAEVKGAAGGRLKVTLHGRELKSLPVEAPDDPVRFPFRLRFEPGVNRVRVEVLAGQPDLSGASVRVFDAIHPPMEAGLPARSIWTHPFVRMDITHPRWIEIVCEQVARLFADFGVDGIHLDAAAIDVTGMLPIYRTLRQAVPRGLIGCEYLAELNYSLFHLTQNGSIPPASPHRLTDFSYRLAEPYVKFYYHLCTTEAFVPTGTVCDHRPVPPELTDEQRARAERQWTEGPRWNILPNIRLNYRDYGLDPRTRQVLTETLGRAAS